MSGLLGKGQLGDFTLGDNSSTDGVFVGGSANAMAQILAFDYPRFAQATADIRVVSFVFAQAQARIIYPGLAESQALADIKQTYPLRWGRDFAHGQIPVAVFTGRPGTDSRYPAPFTNVANATDNDLNTASSTNSDFFFVSTLINYLRFDLGTATPLGDVTIKYARFGGNYGANTNPITIVYADSLGGTDGNGNDTTSWTVATTYTPVESFGATTTVTITNPHLSAHRYWAVGFSQTNIPSASDTTGWSVYDINWLVPGTDKGTFSQAQAKLLAFDYPRFGQANADIKAINTRSGQAQARIKAVSWGFGQAQALVNVPFAWGSAMADILQTYNGFAQAQGKVIYLQSAFAQSQARVIYIFFGEAQAQAQILGIPRQFAQAQADIQGPSTKFGQAQCSITTTTPSAQAQAYILPVAFGQAQAYVRFQSITLPFLDAFTRTTKYGLGTPYYLWNDNSSSWTHPVVVTTYVDTDHVVAPVSPTGDNDSYFIGLSRFPTSYIFSIDIKYNSVTSSETLSILNSRAHPGKFYITRTNAFIIFSETDHVNQIIIPAVDTAITYRFIMTITLERDVLLEVKDAATDALIDTISYSTPDFTDVGYEYVQLNLLAATANPAFLDNLSIEQIVFRGNGQAQAQITSPFTQRFAQAQAIVNQTFALGQSAALIDRPFRFANALAAIIKTDVNRVAQAQAFLGPLQYAQALALIDVPIRYAQAQALILKTHWTWAQAQALLDYHFAFSQAQTYVFINPAIVQQAFALVNADIVGYYLGKGQAQCFIDKPFRSGQAQCFIYQPRAGKLVQYNKYGLPGYLQKESFSSTERLYLSPPPNGFEEYLGRENKTFDISMLVIDQTYQAAKEQVTTAATMLWSNRSGYSKLIVIHAERYYLAKTVSIKLDQTAGAREKAAGYEVSFDCQPWSYGQVHTLTGIDTDDVGRTYLNGTWTPATITLTGTDITVSGYTPNGDFTGFISISGYVENLVLDNDNLSTVVTNGDYALFVAPGRTLFDINGATSYTIEYQDRWEL